MNCKDLVEVLMKTPDYPIYAWVNGEVCDGDCCWWSAKVQKVSVAEFTRVPFEYGWNNTNWVFKDDWEDCVQYLIETEEYQNMFPGNDEETVNEAVAYAENYLNSLEYTKAVFLWIDN